MSIIRLDPAIKRFNNNKMFNPLHIAKEIDDGLDMDWTPPKFKTDYNSTTFSSSAKKYGIVGMFKKAIGYPIEEEEISEPTPPTKMNPNINPSQNPNINPFTASPFTSFGNNVGSEPIKPKSKFLEKSELWKQTEFSPGKNIPTCLCYVANVKKIKEAKDEKRLFKMKNTWVIPHPTEENSFISSEEFIHVEKTEDTREFWKRDEPINGRVVRMILLDGSRDIDDALNTILNS